MAYEGKVKMLEAEEGYDKAFKEYKKMHKDLNKFDQNLWKRFIPKNMEGFNVMDLGGGDGRVSSFFQGKSVNEYQIIDISENMMKGCKSWIKQTKHDLNNPLPIEDDYSDITLCFFTLLYIADPKELFGEIYRTLKEDGIFLLFHHIERKNYEYKIGKERFKIGNFVYNYKQIEEWLDYNFFKFNVLEVKEGNTVVGKLYACNK